MGKQINFLVSWAFTSLVVMLDHCHTSHVIKKGLPLYSSMLLLNPSKKVFNLGARWVRHQAFCGKKALMHAFNRMCQSPVHLVL